jgi:YbbR domain-containing protein
MIDPKNEKIYNILLSIFLAIMFFIMINNIFDCPRIVYIYK